MPLPHYRVDVQGRYLGQDIVNTYMYRGEYHRFDGNIVQNVPLSAVEQITDLRAIFESTWSFVYNSISVKSCIYNTVRYSVLSPVLADRYSQSFPVLWQSDRDVDGLPAQKAVIVTRRHANGTRLWNGRVYYGAIAMEDIAAGIVDPDSDTWTAMTIAANRMALPLNGQLVLWYPCIIRFRKPPLPTGDYSFRQVQRSAPVPQLATQRRRAPGHGRRG